MKSADLIKKLQEIDPSGTLEIFINGNEDILTIYSERMSHGAPVKIIKNDDGETSLKYLYDGFKIVIESRDHTDLIYNDPNISIDYDELPEETKDDCKNLDRMTIYEAKLLYEQSKQISYDVRGMLNE